jgi:hypothetical protein
MEAIQKLKYEQHRRRQITKQFDDLKEALLAAGVPRNALRSQAKVVEAATRFVRETVENRARSAAFPYQSPEVTAFFSHI